MNIFKGILISSAFVFVFGSSVYAKDMILTLDDGRDAILHEDSTWGFAKFTVSEDAEDIFITVGDGRTVWLKPDNTWTFTKNPPPEKRSFSQLPTVNATATATKPSLDVAVKSASEDALRRVTERLIPFAKKSKNTSKYISACVKNEIGENGIETNYKPGWTAVAKISLTKVQVKNILECTQSQIDANPDPEPAPAAKKIKNK